MMKQPRTPLEYDLKSIHGDKWVYVLKELRKEVKRFNKLCDKWLNNLTNNNNGSVAE